MIEALKKIEVEAFCKKGTQKSYQYGAAVAIQKVGQSTVVTCQLRAIVGVDLIQLNL